MPSFNVTSGILEVLKRDDVSAFQKTTAGSWAYGLLLLIMKPGTQNLFNSWTAQCIFLFLFIVSQ